MPYRSITFRNSHYYHVFNRGVEKRTIFSTDQDYQHFLHTLYYYQFSSPKPSFSLYRRFKEQNFYKNPHIVNILAYCLMPNHFHLLLRQNIDLGVQEFVSNVSNSYTKYYNKRHTRIGYLLQGPFKAIQVNTDEQLVHVSRYIHLNPYVSKLVHNASDYSYSSIHEYLFPKSESICLVTPVLQIFKDINKYKIFIEDYQNYALELHKIKHLMLE